MKSKIDCCFTRTQYRNARRGATSTHGIEPRELAATIHTRFQLSRGGSDDTVVAWALLPNVNRQPFDAQFVGGGARCAGLPGGLQLTAPGVFAGLR